MLNQREILFLQILEKLNWLNRTQLTQVQYALQAARSQGNPVAPWDMLVSWRFLTLEQVRYAMGLVVLAEQRGTSPGAAPAPVIPGPVPGATAAGTAPAAIPPTAVPLPVAQPAVPMGIPVSPVAPAPAAIPTAVPAVPVSPAAPTAAPAAPAPAAAPPAPPTAATAAKASPPKRILIFGGIAAAAVIAIAVTAVILSRGGGTTATNSDPSAPTSVTPTPPGSQTSTSVAPPDGNTPPPATNGGTTPAQGTPGDGPPPAVPDTSLGPPPPPDNPEAGTKPDEKLGPPPPVDTPPAANPPPKEVTPDEKQLAALKTQVNAEIGKSQLGAATRLVSDALGQKGISDSLKDQLKAYQKEVQKQVETRYSEALLKAKQLADTNKAAAYDQAIKALEDARRLGVEDYSERITALIDQYRSQKELALAMATEREKQATGDLRISVVKSPDEIGKALEAYSKVTEKLAPVFETRDISQAQKLIDELSADSSTAILKPYLDRLYADLPKVLLLQDKTVASLKTKIGQEIKLPGSVTAKLVSVQADKYDVEVGGRVQSKPFAKLRGRDFMTFLDLTDATAKPEDLIAVGLLYYFDGKVPDALDFFGKAKQPDATRPYEDMVKLAEEKDVQQRIALMKETHKANNFPTLQQQLEELTKKSSQTLVFKVEEAFIQTCEAAVRKYQEDREKKIAQIVTQIESAAKELDKALTEAHYKELKEVQDSKGLAMDDQMAYEVEEKQVTEKEPTTGQNVTITKAFLKETQKKTAKKDNLKVLQDILDNDKYKKVVANTTIPMMAKTERKKIEDLIKRTRRDIQELPLKFLAMEKKLKDTYERNQKNLEKEKDKLIGQVRGGKDFTVDEIKKALQDKVRMEKEKGSD